jgi:hypothetical protein
MKGTKYHIRWRSSRVCAILCVSSAIAGTATGVAGLARYAEASCNNLKVVEGGIAYGSCTGAGTCINVRLNDTCQTVNDQNCQFLSTVNDHFRTTNCAQQPGGNWTCTGSLVSQAGARDDFVGNPCCSSFR